MRKLSLLFACCYWSKRIGQLMFNHNSILWDCDRDVMSQESPLAAVVLLCPWCQQTTPDLITDTPTNHFNYRFTLALWPWNYRLETYFEIIFQLINCCHTNEFIAAILAWLYAEQNGAELQSVFWNLYLEPFLSYHVTIIVSKWWNMYHRLKNRSARKKNM